MIHDDKTFFIEISQALREQGYFAGENFLSPTEVNGLLENARQRLDQGEFHRAGVGRGAKKKTSADEVRRDEICWFEEKDLSPAQEILYRRLQLLKENLNQELLLGLWDFETHYAIYEPGGFYRRHVDRFRNDSARTVSLVLYLNENWQADDGGKLLLYQTPGDPKPIHSVTPKAGTLACFMSSEIEHEVLPARRKRISIATWFRTRK